MKKFKVTRDEKNTIWHRVSAVIEAESLEDAQNILEKRVANEEFIGDESCDWLYGTAEFLTPAQNIAIHDPVPIALQDYDYSPYLTVEFPEQLNGEI